MKLTLAAYLGLFASFALQLGPSPAHADERVRSREQLRREGYKPVVVDKLAKDPVFPYSAHSLSWPIEFQDATHTLGNIMAQYQPFGKPYYHGGIDVRTRGGKSVHAPVAGKLEAGHYSYVTNDDGSMDKMWKAWPQQGESTYFEVAVVTDEGFRFEFHHVNRSTLPGPIVAMLNAGGGRVTVGMELGSAIDWVGQDYDHIHYNIVTPSGVRLNPEFESTLLMDTMAPEISDVVAVFQNGKTQAFGGGVFNEVPTEFNLAVQDHQNGNVYDHPPTIVKIQFDNGVDAGWDFHEKLLDVDGKFPPLWDFFVQRVKTPDGRRLSTSGGYGTGVSVVRLKVPPSAHGKFIILVKDQADNTTTFHGSVP